MKGTGCARGRKFGTLIIILVWVERIENILCCYFNLKFKLSPEEFIFIFVSF